MIATLLAAAVAATAPEAPAQPVATTPRVKRYCILDRREGSLQKDKICRTRDEWRARGFDPILVLMRD